MCRSKQIFCGAKNFCPNFPKLSRKVVLWILPKNVLSQSWRPFLVWPPERYSFVFLQMLGDIFEVKQRWGPFFPRYSRILPRYFRILPRFSGISPKFSGIFPGFLTNQNFCGCACTPCLLHPLPPTPLFQGKVFGMFISTRTYHHQRFFLGRRVCLFSK